MSKHRKQNPPTCAGIAPLRWQFTAVAILIAIVLIGVLL